MKRYSSLLVFMVVWLFVWASEPNGYYQGADNKASASLRQALTDIIGGHTDIGYKALWTLYGSSDLRADGKIWDIYSTCDFTYQADQCGNYTSVCDCYNREHSIPQSWFNEQSPMKSDAFHIYPTDGKVNAERGNLPYGECNSGTTAGAAQLGRKGASSFAGYSGTIFEPDDQYKGDLARTYFYMAIRYADNNLSSGLGKVSFSYNSSATPKTDLTAYSINLFLKWHRNDPVSEKETNRNDAVYARQNNRNPFIDHPILAEYIWGNRVGQTWSLSTSSIDSPMTEELTIFPIPAKDHITVDWAYANSEFDYEVFNLSAMAVASGKATFGNSIDVSSLSEGFYLLRIKTNNSLIIKKITIVK